MILKNENLFLKYAQKLKKLDEKLYIVNEKKIHKFKYYASPVSRIIDWRQANLNYITSTQQTVKNIYNMNLINNYSIYR